MQRFGSLLNRIIRTRFDGKAQDLARRLKIVPQAVSRAKKQPFGLPRLLRLAQVSGENPSTVLRAAGHAEIAQLVEELYGPPREGLSAEHRALLTAWVAIRDPAMRDAIWRTIAAAPKHSRSHSPKGGSGGSTPGMPFPPETGTPPGIADTVLSAMPPRRFTFKRR